MQLTYKRRLRTVYNSVHVENWYFSFLTVHSKMHDLYLKKYKHYSRCTTEYFQYAVQHSHKNIHISSKDSIHAGREKNIIPCTSIKKNLHFAKTWYKTNEMVDENIKLWYYWCSIKHLFRCQSEGNITHIIKWSNAKKTC